MNWRIYKKKAKLAVQLLIAYGGWDETVREKDFYPTTRDDCHPSVDEPGIDGLPVFGYDSNTPASHEWVEKCPMDMWTELHYWTFVVPDDFSGNIDNDEPWPKMTMQQRRERWSTKMIPKGWEWRGKRAVKKHDGRRKSPPRRIKPSAITPVAEPKRRLTAEAEAARDEWFYTHKLGAGCTCWSSPPCPSCLHPGNPLNQETDDCWTTEPVAA